jgi:hypothetical protein
VIRKISEAARLLHCQAKDGRMKMGIKNKVQILLFPVTLAAGIITGIAIERTKKKAAGILAVDAALREVEAENPAEVTAEAENPAEETAGVDGKS